MPKLWIARVELLIDAETKGEACDAVSEKLRMLVDEDKIKTESTADLVDWSYSKAWPESDGEFEVPKRILLEDARSKFEDFAKEDDGS